MNSTNRLDLRSTFAFLLVGLLALLGIVGMTFWLGERAQTYFSEVIGARDLRGSAVELRNALQTAESSQRGFLATGNEIYLAPYDAAKGRAQQHLDELNRLLKPDAQYAAVIGRLATIVSQKLEVMDQAIALKRGGRNADALAELRTGKALMDEANVFFSGVIRAADDRQIAGVGEQTANAAWLRTFAIIGSLIIIAVVGGAALSVLRYTRELRAARDEVYALNAELEGRVSARTADLRQANEEIRRFAYIVTHDLRAPLVSVMGFTGEIERGVKSMQALVDGSGSSGASIDPAARTAWSGASEDISEAIGFIRSSTSKMDGLINAIMKLSREGRRTLNAQTFELADVIRSSAAAIQHQVLAAGGTIHLDLDDLPVVTDKLSFEQIFGNLLENAVKYRSERRPLRIEVRARLAAGDRLDIEVADNGRGIAENDYLRIFELFGRAGPQDQSGEGLGLAYVKTVLRNLGGDISVTSVVGEGTRFQVVVPRNLQAADQLVT